MSGCSREDRANYKADLRAYKDALRSGAWKKRPFNEFLEIVTQRPSVSLNSGHMACPFCASAAVTKLSCIESRLVTTGDFDPNHHWDTYQCDGCHAKWLKEYKGRPRKPGEVGQQYNVWLTTPDFQGRILQGIPTSFPGYVYTCSACGGDVERSYYRNGTREKAIVLETCVRTGKRSYYTMVACVECGVSRVSSNDYYLEESPHKPKKPLRPEERRNGLFQTEFGPMSYDPAWLERLKNIDDGE